MGKALSLRPGPAWGAACVRSVAVDVQQSKPPVRLQSVTIDDYLGNNIYVSMC